MIELKQRHVEAFFKAIRTSGVKPEEVSSPEYTGAVVRCAIEAGILPQTDVGEMLPKEVVKLAREVNNAIGEALAIDSPLS